MVWRFNVYYCKREQFSYQNDAYLESYKESSRILKRREKEKMEAGKYDEAADKFKEVFDKLKGIAKAKDDVGQLTKIDDLEAKRLELERKLEELDRPDDYNSIAPTSKADKEQEIEKDLKQLYEETERLMKDMERN